jgi:23S rRNA pseudouridine2604 synthase
MLKSQKTDPEFPMRINKYLALKGYSTRRGADDLIAKKAVTINGRFAVLGDKVTETDVVEVRKNKMVENYVYYACYKPSGITVLDTRKGQKGFINSLPKGLFPVGSLDRDASGLIIFTNDRRIIDRLENPNHAHPKQYLVETIQPLRANFKDKLNSGVSLDGGPIIPCHVELKGPTACYITITDPKNRIRQICSLFGAETARLIRTAILNIQLKNMKQNGFRRIDGDELAEFLKNLGL